MNMVPSSSQARRRCSARAISPISCFMNSLSTSPMPFRARTSRISRSRSLLVIMAPHTYAIVDATAAQRHCAHRPLPYEVTQLGVLAFGSTLNRIHIPTLAVPRDAAETRKLPVAGALKFMMSVPPWGRPCVTSFV